MARMMAFIFTSLLATVFISAAPAHALTAKQKMETCKFGADDQKLQGKARSAFMSKCMANEKVSKPKPAPKPAT